ITQTADKKRKRTIVIAAIAGFLVFLCIACIIIALIQRASPEGQATSTQRAIIEATEVMRLTDTTAPTDTPKPTDTPEPTNTPKPSNTPKPTNTPKPSNTPQPPTATPEPILLTGSGDAVVDVDIPFNIAVVHITGNASGRYFGVTSYGEDGEQINLLVNTP